MAYTTKQKVADLLGIDVINIKDDWVTWADSEVDLRTGKSFTEMTVTNKKYDGSGNDELVLNEYPITSITKVEYLQQYTPTEVWMEIVAEYWRVYEDTGILKLVPDLSGLTDINEFEEGVQNWRISYKYGYTDTPKIIEFLATLFAAQMYQVASTAASGSISSEHIGDYSVSYDVGSESGEVKIQDLIDSILVQVSKSNLGLKGL